jgi:hypothetical protein
MSQGGSSSFSQKEAKVRAESINISPFGRYFVGLTSAGIFLYILLNLFEKYEIDFPSSLLSAPNYVI